MQEHTLEDPSRAAPSGPDTDSDGDESVPLMAWQLLQEREKRRSRKKASEKSSNSDADDFDKTAPTCLGRVLETPDRLMQFHENLVEEFGVNLLFMLFTAQHILKGFVNQLYSVAEPFLFKEYSVSGPQQQIYYGIVRSPWALKPVIGLISDVFPIFGYNKAPYIIISTFFGVACHAIIGYSHTDQIPVSYIVVGLFGITQHFSVTDLMTEAKYSERLQQNPRHGPNLITWVWSGINAGSIFALAIVGSVLAYGGPHLIFKLAIVPAALVLWPTCRNYLEENQKTPEEVAKMRQDIWREREVVFLAVLIAAMVVWLSIIGLFATNKSTPVIVSVTCCITLLIAFSALIRPDIAKVNCFFICQTSLALGLRGATFYFYTDSETEYPNGPHFSTEFYTTGLQLVAMFFSITGLALYNTVMKDWSYRWLLLIGNSVCSLFYLMDLIIFTRKNLEWGIPDHVFVLGSSCQEVVRQWQWMPGIVVMSQLCPKGMEATMFALLAGCHNLGNLISEYMGAYVLELLDVTPTGAPNEGVKFENLWKASVLSTCLPMFTVLLIPILIPDARQTDVLLVNNPESATAGSPLSRWLGRDQERERLNEGASSSSASAADRA